MAARQPGIAYSLTIRAEYPNEVGMLGRITSAIGTAGGDIGAIDIAPASRGAMVRDITFNARDVDHGQAIVEAVREVDDVTVISVSDQVFLRHLGGKIEIREQDLGQDPERHVHRLHPRGGPGEHGDPRGP